MSNNIKFINQEVSKGIKKAQTEISQFIEQAIIAKKAGYEQTAPDTRDYILLSEKQEVSEQTALK